MYYLRWVSLGTNLRTCPQAPLMQLNLIHNFIMPMERILLTILYAFLAWLLYYAESAGDNWKDRLPSLFLFILLVGAIPEGVRLTRRLLHRLRRDWHSHRSMQH